MPDLKEIYGIVTQQTPPKPGALERQHREQRRRTTRRKAGVYGLVAALVILGGVLVVSRRSDHAQPAIPGATATPSNMLPFGPLEPGNYLISAIDRGFDELHRITISVPAGYEGFQRWMVLKRGTSQTGVSASVVGNVYADPCQWRGTLIQPPVGSHFDALVAALANQPGRHATTPTDVTVDGFAGKYMELTAPAGVNLAHCDLGHFISWLDTGGGWRYNEPGQHDLLWIVNVDGVPLVIDAGFEAGTSAQVRDELIQMVETLRIDPR